MGRGRQKAKQTKVARQLKYFSPDTDYNALQRELAGGPGDHGGNSHAEADPFEAEDDEVEEEDDDDADQYANWSPEPNR